MCWQIEGSNHDLFVWHPKHMQTTRFVDNSSDTLLVLLLLLLFTRQDSTLTNESLVWHANNRLNCSYSLLPVRIHPIQIYEFNTDSKSVQCSFELFENSQAVSYVKYWIDSDSTMKLILLSNRTFPEWENFELSDKQLFISMFIWIRFGAK